MNDRLENKEIQINFENQKCEECKKEDESVFQNLILIGFKLCKSCCLSKTLFPF